MPRGAKRITILTTLEIASLKSWTVVLVWLLACFSDKPKPSPQANTAMKLLLAIALIGFSTTLKAKVDNTSPNLVAGWHQHQLNLRSMWLEIKSLALPRQTQRLVYQ